MRNEGALILGYKPAFLSQFRTKSERGWIEQGRANFILDNLIAAGKAKPHVSKLNKSYQATLGGPIVKDRLWFFLAGRKEDLSESRSLSITGGSYEFSQKNPRIEGKLSEPGVMLHAVLGAAYVAYGLFWMWHRPVLGLLFTLWLPLAFISATSPSGFSWRAKRT